MLLPFIEALLLMTVGIIDALVVVHINHHHTVRIEGCHLFIEIAPVAGTSEEIGIKCFVVLGELFDKGIPSIGVKQRTAFHLINKLHVLLQPFHYSAWHGF